MFNKNLAAILKDKNLPSDLTWLAPMGTWSTVVTPHDDSIESYSVSGIGNQGIPLGISLAGTGVVLASTGVLPNLATSFGSSIFPKNNQSAPPGPAPAPPNATNPAPPPAPTEPAAATNAPPTDASGNSTNAPPPPTEPAAATNAPPATAPPSDSTTNAPPSAPAPSQTQ
jgi:hypothetical protein